jgi:hypothetical protein
MDGAVRRATAAALLTVVMVACGNGGTATGATDATTSEASATDAPQASTPAGATTEASPTTTPILSDEEQGCVDAFMTYLVDIEDVVSGFDFAAATLLEYQDLLVKLVPAGQALAHRVKGMRCAVLDGTISAKLAPIIVDIARTEAPGSVPYLELLIASSELGIAGSCVKDIAALERYVDAGGTVRDVSVEERFHAFDLVMSINATCSLMTGGRFLSSNKVERFLEIG